MSSWNSQEFPKYSQQFPQILNNSQYIDGQNAQFYWLLKIPKNS